MNIASVGPQGLTTRFERVEQIQRQVIHIFTYRAYISISKSRVDDRDVESSFLLRSGSEWQASLEREGGRRRQCRRGGGRRAGGNRESRQMADIRLPGDLSGQIPDRLASASDRVHGAASRLQLHHASRRANVRSLRG